VSPGAAGAAGVGPRQKKMSRREAQQGTTGVTAPPETPPNVTPYRDDLSGRQVFEILAHEHADMLVSFLRSLVRAPDVVDDLFQEAMITAWRRLADYDRTRPFGPWLRGIAVRLVLKHRERSARDLLSCDPAVLETLETRFDEVSRQPEGFRDSIDRLLLCLARLPDKLRSAVELAYRKGLLLRQVARRLDASEEAVKKRVQRARGLLADCLSEGTR